MSIMQSKVSSYNSDRLINVDIHFVYISERIWAYLNINPTKHGMDKLQFSFFWLGFYTLLSVDPIETW